MIITIVLTWEEVSLADEQKTRIAVDIYGQTYKMVGTETSTHMRLVASMVDERMREISAHNPYLDSTKIAVLTAVNSVHDYLELKKQVEQLKEELNKLKG
ncbi:cell division protein ZapA [Sporosarcina sp. ANT_H38]|uniref:cell division protein ZapA n=2 Tax=Sporosarcina sp. ANT_H38 TaxID=2597358 RepID=UPI00351A4F28